MAFRPGKHHYLLLIIFLLVLSCRFYYSFQTPYFSDSESYFTMRQAEHISSTGLPILHDDLSYGGRTHVGSPFFYYVVAFFNIFMPISMVGKVVMNIFASSLVIIVYLTAYELSRDRNASLFSAFIAGFIPVFFRTTFNSLSVNSLAFPILLFCVYSFLKIRQKSHIYAYLTGLFMLTLLSPLALLLAAGFVFYIALLKLDRMRQNKAELEVIFFSIFFIIWFLFIIYKKALLFHGAEVIWMNVPSQILKDYFGGISILNAVYQIGSIPLMYAIYSVLQHIYRPKQRMMCIFSGLAFSTLILIWARVIEPYLGLTYLGIIAVVLFAQFYKWSFQYWRNTHFARFRSLLTVGFFIALLLTSILPSLSYASKAVDNTMKDDEAAILRWVRENTPENSTVLAPLDEGHLITGIAGRKNVADDNFLMIDDASKRYNDIESIYTAMFETEALLISTGYSIDYIIVTPSAREEFGIDSLAYAPSDCFTPIYNSSGAYEGGNNNTGGNIGDVMLYRTGCRMKELDR
ncbi:MAG: hypothetical protein R6U32_00345 [Candidatus Woesearchaeota archaeon]